MTPVYAYYADLISRTPTPDHELCKHVEKRIVDWLQGDIAGASVEFDGQERFFENGLKTLTAKREKVDAFHELASFDYRHPSPDKKLLYRLQLDLVRVPQGVQFAVRQAAHTLTRGLEEHHVRPALPPVVRHLAMDADLQVLGEAVPLQAVKLEEKFVPRFLDTVLVNPARVLPVVALSPHPAIAKPIVPAEQLLTATFGLCHVVDLLTKQSTFEISNRLGRQWSCYNGAVRIYWPSIKPDEDDIYKHPIYFPDHYPDGTQAELCADIFRRLAAATLLKFNDAPKLAVFRRAQEKQRLERENARIHELTAGAEKSKELTALLQQLQRERDDLKRELSAANTLLNEQVDVRNSFQQQWADFGRQLSEAERAIAREAERADRMARRVLPKLESVKEAVQFALEDFGDVLRFLPSAVKAAADSPYAHPVRVYDLFRGMATLQRRIRSDGSLGTNLFEAYKEFGFEYKDKISMTSATKFGDEYTFTVDGRPMLFEHHVTIGSGPPRTCISVHWIHDERTRQYVVGWCGNHLTNTRT